MEEVQLTYRSVDGVVNSVYFSSKGNIAQLASGPDFSQVITPISRFYEILETAARSNGGVRVIGTIDGKRKTTIYESGKPHEKAKSFQELLDRIK